MSSDSSPFNSLDGLERRFADGLAAMLDAHRSLGVYILALANAAYDPRLWMQLAPALAERHAELAASVVDALRRGETLAEPDDDVLVFLKLALIGFERLVPLQSRRDGPWQMRFNPLRALRPPRASSQAFEGLRRPFSRTGFHFNKPFLARELLWEGELAGKPARLFYNKFPFARLHGLVVPEPQRELAQCLTPELHAWAWDACAQSRVPGLCLGYNSQGAGASVNHLHFQSFVQDEPLPVQAARFAHNGGPAAYPLPCRRFDDPSDAWLEIERLHRMNLPYNLVYRPGSMHCVPRLPQDSDALHAQSRGYGWSEMAGAVTLYSREAYDALDASAFEAVLARFAP